MAILQYYYTSWYDEAKGDPGFKVKALSPGITQEMQAAIEKYIGYEIPPGADVRDITGHPTSLRYVLLDAHTSMLINSQSNGPDENGRPGNFFAHALIADPEVFTTTPPIFFWHSPFWKTRDEGAYHTIPPLPSLDAVPLTFDDLAPIWQFLAQGNRREQLYQLLCAVVMREERGKRIIIVDEPDNVALWLAAVSCALPPRHRPLLSFSTYQAAIERVGYAITGVLPTSTFGREFYGLYFILNGVTGQVSDVPPSAFARAAADAMRLDLYEEDWFGVLDVATRRFPPPTRIDAQLNLVPHYITALAPQRQIALTADEIAAVNAVLAAFEQVRTFGSSDLADLRAVRTTLQRDLHRTPNPAVLQAYRQTTQLLRRRDAATAADVAEDVQLALRLLASCQFEAGAFLLTMARDIFGADAAAQTLNTPAALNTLTSAAQHAPPRALAVLWRDIAPLLTPVLAVQGFMLASLRAVANGTDANAILAAMAAASAGKEPAWLEVAIAGQSAPPPGLGEYYYTLVQPLPLEQRTPLRAIVLRVDPRVVADELRRDLVPMATSGVPALLEEWAAYAQRQQIPFAPLLQGALGQVHDRISSAEWQLLAKQILVSAQLEPQLDDAWRTALLKAALGTLSWRSVTRLDIALSEKFLRASGLTPEARILMMGVLAMDSGKLDRSNALEARKRFASMKPEDYAAEAEQFIAAFFGSKVTREAHGEMVAAAYRLDQQQIFWQKYWAQFTQLLLAPQGAAQIIDLLSFWFDASLSALGNFPYAVQTFFLELPDAIEPARKERAFRENARDIARLGATQPWFPLVQDLFAQERHGILGIFGR